MNLRFHTRNTPSARDPLGLAPDGDGVASTLPARWLSGASPQLRVEVLGANGERETRSGVVEGDQPGQVETATGVARAVGAALRSRLEALAADADPAVRLSVRVLAALHSRQTPVQVAHDLLQLAENTSQPRDVRVAALQWLERLIPRGEE